tara:strand:- start:1174 stop:5781 length:4608 start_codon:yes stop_codon:yes gene_type:complete
LWEADCILQEKRVGKKLKYLIKWKGTDPATGEDYEPTWEPEENPTEALLAEWTEKKAQREEGSASATTEGSKPRGRRNKHQNIQHQPRPRRKLRLVESSPDPSTAHTPIASSQPSTPARDSVAPAVSSSALTTPVGKPAHSTRASPKVRVEHPGGGFDPDEYERFSQLAASNPPSTESQTQDTDLDSSQLFAAVPPYRSSGVVPDSQSSAGEGSFVPQTQQTTGTTQQSSTVNDTQEDVTEDSVCLHASHLERTRVANQTLQGLLEIVQNAASRAHSPARSIPETVYDNTAESLSQHHREASPERIEINESGESVESGSLFIPELPEGEQRRHSHTQQDEDVDLGAQPAEQQADTDSASQQIAPASPVPPPPPVEATQRSQDLGLPAHKPVYEGDLREASPASGCPTGDCQVGAGVSAHEIVELSNVQTAASNLDSAPIEQSGEGQRHGETTGQSHTESGTEEPQRLTVLQPIGSQDQDQASLAEHSGADEPAQFPFHSQHPPHEPRDLTQPSENGASREEIGVTLVTDPTAATAEAVEQSQQQEAPAHDNASGPATTSSSTAAEGLLDLDELLVSSTHPEVSNSSSELLELEVTQSQLLRAQPKEPAQAEVEALVQSTYASHETEEESIRHRDFAFESQPPRSTNQSTASREQNAQVVSHNNDLGTQEDAAESIRPTIEKNYVAEQSSPDSRHDSSQETPDRQLSLSEHSSSPIAQPPEYSLGTVDSNVPGRPRTPILTSSISIMASQDTGAEIERQMKESLLRRQAENPFTPKSRLKKSNFTPSSAATPAGSPSIITSGRRLLRTGASPTLAAAEGTRSPSTVPDRSPAPPAPTSLRTIALTHASQTPTTGEAREETARDVGEEPPVKVADVTTSNVPAIITTQPTIPEFVSSEEEELMDVSDNDDDTASLLNDDLSMAVEEHIVPLFIEGRQSDMYSAYIKQKQESLDGFLKNPQGYEPLAQVDEILTYLRAIETHIDLVFAEARAVTDDAMNPATQINFTAQFGMENSTKFRFLHSLFHAMRDHNKHIVLVVEEDNAALFNVIEIFCRANFIDYNMPVSGRRADPADVEGALLVSVLPCDTSPILRPADVIICLDGVQDATRIRTKNWAANPELKVVPVLHLVISRTVGHVERYLSSSLDKRKRIHTILASLAQMRGDLGKPIDEDTPRAPLAAAQVAEWLITSPVDRGIWPLGSIGSVNEIVEYQTQVSQTSATSPPPTERSKRPHDDEELDSAKRMRFTPQPQTVPASSTNNDNEITRISDSMPSTAMDNASALRAQLARIEEKYQKERSLRRAEAAHFEAQEAMWTRQQFVHENLSKEHRLLLGKQQSTEEKLDTMTKNNETLRERLAASTGEKRTLSNHLTEQRNTHLLSDDAKIAEITKLRNDIATANDEKTRALKDAQISSKTLEYTNHQYREAQDAATRAQNTVTDLEKQVKQLTHAASGEPAKLKALHLNRQYQDMAKQLKALKSENAILKATLKLKDEELQRVKMSGNRMGVGTRATSATPRPRSRATSPMMGGRLSNLRNG